MNYREEENFTQPFGNHPTSGLSFACDQHNIYCRSVCKWILCKLFFSSCSKLC